MKQLIFTAFTLFALTSCDQSRVKELESENRRLQSELEDTQSELDDANTKIQEYEEKFDNISSMASDGYDAISFFNWSHQLQEALDAFEDIESEASY